MDWSHGIVAALTAAIAGLFAWFTQRSKGQVDESVSVRAEWAKLNGALSDRLSAVEKQLAEVQKQSAQDIADLRREHSIEIAEMRTQHAKEIRDIREKHRAEMKVMRELNEGLQRMIAQNSKSTVQLMGDSLVTPLKRASDGEGGK